MAKMLTDAERKAATAFLRGLDVFTELRTAIPSQYLRTFLFVAMDEGKPIGEYARKAGVAPSVMSRHVLDLSDGSRRVSDEGLGLLVSKLNPNNRREHIVYLTDVGKAVFGKIVRNLEH